MPRGNLVPRPGAKPRPTAVKAPSPNHWTTREFPKKFTFKKRFDMMGQGVCGKSLKFLVTFAINLKWR